MYDRITDLAESSGPRSTSHGHMRSGRGFCGLMNPNSSLRALAIDPGSSDYRKKSIIRFPEEEYQSDCMDEIFNQSR